MIPLRFANGKWKRRFGAFSIYRILRKGGITNPRYNSPPQSSPEPAAKAPAHSPA